MTSSRPTLPRIALFLGIAIAGCAIDLGTKTWIFGKLDITPPKMEGAPDPIVFVPGVFGLTTSLNTGALFGMGHGRIAVFAVLSIVAAIGILYWIFYGGARNDIWLCVALGNVMAGIFGNLYDRLGFPGLIWPQWVEYLPLNVHPGEPVYAVRDWIHFQIARIGFDWPIFNIADSLLVTGAIMLFVHVAWRERRTMAKPAVSAVAK
jgi:signal peptidase II